jgi:hypothetical protein
MSEIPLCVPIKWPVGAYAQDVETLGAGERDSGRKGDTAEVGESEGESEAERAGGAE